ncbi:hypothetical protein ASF88_08685 [Leifsonia sp. Leaf336]|uniref:hypothetical protein n=1 Tax=Leifsonia sp. Leaf336 TaxID=1736341 RepID=UPI0006FA729A|nr:hypothetical protein [Leifsonia sp. Leaf336]KQR54804.1 hypothetical protein ASF88_08685 [Leifsonia sp. Leaf336]
MTAITVPAHRPFSHRAALRLGRALTAWGMRQPARHSRHAELVAAAEQHRDRAARMLPQLPR